MMRAAGRLFIQPAFAMRPVLDHLPTMPVFHFLPSLAFVAGAQAAHTEAGFRVNLQMSMQGDLTLMA
jgi:hypothetical protein